MPDRLRWGILGTGNIARQFSIGLAASHRGQLRAVGSRTIESAKQFAQHVQLPLNIWDYESLLKDADIDAIYNALPNSLHHEWTIKALRAGKHVLCEKPFATNVPQSAEMFDVAKQTGKTTVEAFMYRSNPLTHAVLAAVKSGVIGQLKLIRTSFCYRTTKISGNVRFNRELAGGSLMDIGCYCINFSRLFAAAEPTRMTVSAHIHETGVDDLAAATLQFPNDIIASFTCGMSAQADNTAYLCGTDGFIEVPVPWKPPAKEAIYVLARGTPPKMDSGLKQPLAAPAKKTVPVPVFGVKKTVPVPVFGELYGLEADNFAATVLDGNPPAISRQDTLGNMRVLDELRRQIGLA